MVFNLQRSTVSSILAGKNFRRALESHVRTFVALQQSYFTAFFQHHPSLRSVIHTKVQEFRQSFNSGSSRNAVELLTTTMNAGDLDSLIKTFDERECKAEPMFRMLRMYMRMIELLLQFLRATRIQETGNFI